MVLEHSPKNLRAPILKIPFRLELTLSPEALQINLNVWYLLGSRCPADLGLGRPLMPYSLGFHPYFKASDPARDRLDGLPGRCFGRHRRRARTPPPCSRSWSRGVDLLATCPGMVSLTGPLEWAQVWVITSAPLDRVVVWAETPRP